MPKENTHLYFANKILEKIEDQNLKSAIKNNLDYFYLGSITPDVFFYGKNEKITGISELFHKKGAIEYTKENLSQNPIFALGILTHIILDDVFHPVIESLSGDYYDQDPVKKKEAMYLHRHLETYLDDRVNDSFFCDKLLNLEIIELIEFLKNLADKFQISGFEIKEAYKRNRYLNRYFRGIYLFNVARLLNKTGFAVKKEDLALFYGNLKKDKRTIKNIDIDALFKQAELNVLENFDRIYK